MIFNSNVNRESQIQEPSNISPEDTNAGDCCAVALLGCSKSDQPFGAGVKKLLLANVG
jgi:hypothetical protein